MRPRRIILATAMLAAAALAGCSGAPARTSYQGGALDATRVERKPWRVTIEKAAPRPTSPAEQGGAP